MVKAPKVQRTDPELWETCKEEALKKMGMFSARTMQYAVTLYKQRGGSYIGQKSSENPLVKWSKNQKQHERE